MEAKMRKIIAKVAFLKTILICLLASCSLVPGAPGKAYIVCIGLDYSETEVTTLNGTTNDALETAVCLATLYERRGIETHVCLIDSCTATDIRNLLSGLELKKNDYLVFYWSGHGHKDDQGMFLVAYPEKDESYSEFYISELTDFTEKLPCPSLILLDCCYAGCAAKDFELSVLGKDKLNKSAVIASCTKEELSLMSHVRTEDGPYQAHSVFTVALLEQLGWVHSIDKKTTAGSLTAEGYVPKDPGRLTASELGQRIRNNVSRQTQHPVFERTDIPVFVIP